MTSRANTVFVVLLMVLSVFVSGLYTAPNTTQNELNENNPQSLYSGPVPCAGDYNLTSFNNQNDSGKGGDVYYSEITGNNVSYYGIVGSNDTLDDYCVVLNPGESIILSSMCASNATDCNNSSIGVRMWHGALTAWNGTAYWVNLTSNISSLPMFTNNLTTNETFGFGFASGSVEMYYSYHIWKVANQTGGNGSGNNSGPTEWIVTWADGSNFTSNSTIGVNWSAGDLVTNITYNVTVDVYAYNATSNTTYVIWDGYTVFSATSNASSGMIPIPYGTLSMGCYFASVDISDNSTGTIFDYDGFNFGVEFDCSNGAGGNGSGNNSGPTEWLVVWADGSNFTSNSTIGVNWTAGGLSSTYSNGSYKYYALAVNVYTYNPTNNTTYVIWSDNSNYYNASSTPWLGATYIPNATLPTGCYFVSVSLYDSTSSASQPLDADGFDLDVGMDCNNSNTGTMESVWGGASVNANGSYNSIIWDAYDLVNGTNYNVTLGVWKINETTLLHDPISTNYTVFNSSSFSGFGSWNYNANGSWADGWWTTYWTTGCYYVSIDLFDNDDGMHFDNYGWNYDAGMDCSGGSSNNTGNASGAFVNAWPTHGTGNLSDYEMALDWANITVSASNLTNGSQYLLEYEISNDTGSIVDTGSWNWTAMDIEEIHILDVSSLGQGCYEFEVWLSDELGYLEYENWPFTIDLTFADCNNNTGNATDCGTLDNLTDLMVWTDQTMYYEGDTVEGTFVTNCTVLNQTYILGYEIYDVVSGIVVLNNSANMWTWTAYYTSDYHTVNWSGLNVSDYAVYGYLMDSSYNTIVDGTYLFSVNAPTTAWGNGTARFIYIKPLAQSADQNTPFNLTFPAPPMADNSPYPSNMICSKAVGHSADVWETYVPMPFNNITSWKVENTYGLVMGMFVMNDAQAAGISSMQNPTVIFEQNLSFSGHAPSTLVDQGYFNCPMVTVSSSLSPVMSPGGSVLSYVVGLSVNNSGDWIGDLNWEVATVSNGSSTALMDIGGHLLIEASGALLDHNFSPTGIAADEICLNWELIDESGVELSSGSECIDFTPLSEPTCTVVTISNVNTEYVKGNSVVAWFNTELDCHGHSLAYWVNSSTSGTAYSGIIDVDVNDPSSWSSTGTNEVSTVELFQTSDGGLIVDNHCITVQVSAYDAIGGVISPHIDSDTVCFNVVTTATEECIPWNNAACDTEFACEDGYDKVAVDATDNVTGVAIEVWECQESDGTDDGSSGLLPSIGIFGTFAASMFAVFIIAVRRDEE